MAEQQPFGLVNLAEMSKEPRCACVLLLDVSGSMGEIVSGASQSLGYTVQQDGKTYQAVSGGLSRIDLLNEGLRAYHVDLISDSLASQRVEVAVITFGGKVEKVTDFVTASEFNPPTLTASGETPMGEAIIKAIDAIEERKQWYRQGGLHYYRPWIFFITDGEPTDDWKAAAEKVHEGERTKKFAFFAVAVEGANLEILRQITVRTPLKLKGNSFRDMFVWLSRSQSNVASKSTPGQEDKVRLAPPDWAHL